MKKQCSLILGSICAIHGVARCSSRFRGLAMVMLSYEMAIFLFFFDLVLYACIWCWSGQCSEVDWTWHTYRTW